MSGLQILPVELVGETCTYDVGNGTTRVEIPFQLSEPTAASEMGFHARTIHVGWDFGEGFKEEVNLSCSRKGS